MDAFLPGYAVYLATIILPGIGIGELLHIWTDKETLAERVAWALGIGLSFDTLVFLLTTSGLQIGAIRLAGIGLGAVYFILGVGLSSLVAGLVLHKKFSFPMKAQRADLLVGGVILSLGVLFLAYFNKYPIFPEYQSPDYQAHIDIARDLLSGTLTSIPSGVLYYGVHYQLASAILLVGGEPLVVVRTTMALLAMLSPLLIYLASVKLFGRGAVGLLNCVIYSFSGTIWFGSVFNSGLYANFFGILVALFLFASLVSVTAQDAPRSAWAVFVLSVIAAYFSHYTAATVFVTVFLVAVVQAVVRRNQVRRFAAPSVLLLAPGALAAVAYPRLVDDLLTLATHGAGSLVGMTTLSTLLSPVPVLSFIALEITDDLATVVFFVLAFVFAYEALKRREVGLFLPILWLVSLLIAAPFSEGTWRFSYEALVPLTLMAGYSVLSIIHEQAAGVKGEGLHRGRIRWKPRLFVVFALFLLLAGSWGQRTILNVTDSPDASSQAQKEVYSSIYWLRDNTPQNSSYLSVSDWRFTYSSLLIGRNTVYGFTSQPEEATKFAKSNGLSYVLVTKLVTVNLPPVPQLFPWNNFPSTGTTNLTLVYSGTDVRIYKVH